MTADEVTAGLSLDDCKLSLAADITRNIMRLAARQAAASIMVHIAKCQHDGDNWTSAEIFAIIEAEFEL